MCNFPCIQFARLRMSHIEITDQFECTKKLKTERIIILKCIEKRTRLCLSGSLCYDGEHKIDFCSRKMLLMNSHFSSHFWHTKQQLRLRYTKLYFANAFPFPFRLTSICHCILSPFHALSLSTSKKLF